MRKLSFDRCVLQTDFGQINHPTPTEGYSQFVQLLLDHGLQEEEIRKMACDVPAELLSLS
jgi:hypothetical protein